MKKLFIMALMVSSMATVSHAEKIITIAKDTKVFETTVAKDQYAAQNSAGEDVILKEGMCFETKDEKGGWYVIEYTDGLRGNVMQNVVASGSIPAPKGGNYTVKNNPSKSVSIEKAGNEWTLKADNETFNGKEDSNAVIFFNADGKPIYSLSMINGKPNVFTYDNKVTKFY